MEEVRCRRFTLCGVVRPPATLPGIRNQLSIQCYVFLHTNEQRRQMWRVRKAGGVERQSFLEIASFVRRKCDISLVGFKSSLEYFVGFIYEVSVFKKFGS
ncbi:hypothetical protein CDAR_432981 [Caerostris darwini]|uniref:Uncharacterized protein n=1 Tax=Caerostris darwini TaxID=1538125 RepID=A0AAV4QKK3_9ARAC|nr:hypothetical protein CDAR_432981 [Caerostris darwini]